MQAMQSLWSLTWKEYRVQRSLWLAVLVLTTLIQVLITLVLFLTSGAPIGGAGYLVIAFVATAVYMLGCGATLFALEHESGTFDFQRVLPARTWQVYIAKLGVGFSSGLLLLVVLLTLAQALFAPGPNSLSLANWLAGCVNFTEVFLWAVLFSLLLRHPLRAAVCGIAATSVSVCLVLPWTFTLSAEGDVFLFHRSFLETRIAIIGLLFVIDSWLTWRWMEGRIGLPSWWSRRTSRGAGVWQVPATQLRDYDGVRTTGWGRLIGISWRQGRWVLVGSCGLFLWAYSSSLLDGMQRSSSSAEVTILLAIGSAIFLGLCSFTLDQWSYQFRFYAERGVSPHWLWLSRQVVWFSPVFVQAICVQLLMEPSISANSPIDQYLNRGGIVLILVTFYAVSQFWAMIIRSALVAFVVSIFSAVVSWCWMLLMIGGGIPIWWSVLPLPVIAMVATWRFSADWLEERRNRRHWAQLSLVTGLPSLVILLGCALWRAYGIPLVDPGFSVTELTRPLTSTEQETLEIYAEADRMITERFRSLEGLPKDSQLLAEDAAQKWLLSALPALPLLERAHERPPVPLSLVKGFSSAPYASMAGNLGGANPNGFLFLLRLQAESLTRDGKLSEAWRYYEIALELVERSRIRAQAIQLHSAATQEQTLLGSIVRWAASPGQTTDQLAVALARLDGLESQESGEMRLAKIQYVNYSQFLAGEMSNFALLGLQIREAQSIQWALALTPWEKARLRRLLNLSTRIRIDPTAVERHLWYGPSAPLELRHGRIDWLFGRADLYSDRSLTSHRRAARILVAICDWQRTHGKLPETLSELVGPYLREMPMDPAAGQMPFRYFPLGLQETRTLSEELSSAGGASGLPDGTPCLMSRDGVIWQVPLVAQRE